MNCNLIYKRKVILSHLIKNDIAAKINITELNIVEINKTKIMLAKINITEISIVLAYKDK